MSKGKVYIAGSLDPERRGCLKEIAKKLRSLMIDVYAPWEHEIEHAWDWPNDEWGLMVFENDIAAIREADWVVVLSYGRVNTTAGTAWEQGFAFGIGKPILLVEMTNDIQSLMVANGRYATIKWENGNVADLIADYLTDVFCGLKPLQLRTNTEQK